MTATQPMPACRFHAEGVVAEILEAPGQRHARVVLSPGTVLDVHATDAADLHLGDEVAIQGSLTVDCLVARPGSATPGKDA